MDAKLQLEMFRRGANDPGGYFLMARKLKQAADQLAPFPLAEDLSEADFDRIELFPVHLMLLGFSFENLLKGLLLAQGIISNDSGKLSNKFKTHKTNKLMELMGKSVPAVSSLGLKERKLIEDLVPYVEHAGRYPLPTTPGEVIAKATSTQDYAEREVLWKQLALALKDVAWIEKVDGTKLYCRDA